MGRARRPLLPLVALALALPGAAGTAREASADLSVHLGAPTPATAGRAVNHTVLVKNTGPDAAAAVTVGFVAGLLRGSDPVPAFLPSTVTSGQPCLSSVTGTTCSMGALASGSSRELTLAVHPRQAGTIVAGANVTSPTPDPSPANNGAQLRTAVKAAALTLRAVRLQRDPPFPRQDEKLYVVLTVIRSDTGGLLVAGRMECKAAITGKRVALLLRESYPAPTCLWRIPAATRGKLLRGSIAIRFRDKKASRTFSFRVR